MKNRLAKILLLVAILTLALSSLVVASFGATTSDGVFEYVSGGVSKTSVSGESFSDIVDAADAGTTIKMTADYTEESSINGYIATVKKNLTLDMGGYTFTIRNRYDNPTDYGQPRIAIYNSTLNVKNGTLIAGHITSNYKTRAYPFFQFTYDGGTLNLENVNSYMSTLFYTWGNSNVNVNITGGEHHSIFTGYGCDGGYLDSRAGAFVKATDARFYLAKDSWLLSSLHQNDKLATKVSTYDFVNCDIVTENDDVNIVKYASEYTTVSFTGCNILGGKIAPAINSGDANKGIGIIADGGITIGEGTSWYEGFSYDEKVAIADPFRVALDEGTRDVALAMSTGNLCDGLTIAESVTTSYATMYTAMDPDIAEKVTVSWYDENGEFITSTEEPKGVAIIPPALEEYTTESNGWYNISYDKWAPTLGGEAPQNLIATSDSSFYLTRGTISAGVTSLKYNLTLMGHVRINIYLPTSVPEGVEVVGVYKSESDAYSSINAISPSELVTISKEKHLCYILGDAGATSLDEVMTAYVKFNLSINGETKAFTQGVSLSALGYIKTILADSEGDKIFPATAHELVANIIRYSYNLEAAAGLTRNTEVRTLYGQYVSTLCRDIVTNTDDVFPVPDISLGDLTKYIYSIAFEVGGYQPRFRIVFVKGSGVTDMNISLEGWYAGRTGEANWREQTFSYDKTTGILYYDSENQYVNLEGVVCDVSGTPIEGATAGEITSDIAVLYSDNIQVYNIDRDITINLTTKTGATASGQYNLNAYYNGIKSGLTATQLLNIRKFLQSMREYGESVVRYRFAEGKVTEGSMETPTVKYSDFGAKGDGITNDFYAIKAAHDFANEKGYKVFGDEGATYYISKTEGKSITIKTDTDWCGASFIIDDSDVAVSDPERGGNIFVIAPDNQVVTYKPDTTTTVGKELTAINTAGGIENSTFTKLDLGLGYPALVYLINDNHRCYIRYGENQDTGSAQRELVLIDKDGNVDESTPLLFDYDEITYIQVVRADDTPISVGNGNIKTIANSAPRKYTYYSRNIVVSRSNTTVYGISHTIEGEGDTGAPYSGFITVSYANNVEIRDSVLSAHKAYKLEGNDNNTMGTYDLSFGNANKVTCYNVTMHNFFAPGTSTPSVKAGWWGIMGSNYCKNLTYDTCKLTRFDAHCGTYNATIKNSELGTLTLIGGGLFTMENTKVYTHTENHLITLRGDYGSTWNGEFMIKDVTAVTGTYLSTSFNLINGAFTNHNFGYACYMPNKVTVDNFKVSGAYFVETIYLANGTITNEGVGDATYNGAENLNPYTVTKTFVVKNNSAGYTYKLPSAFTGTTMTSE